MKEGPDIRSDSREPVQIDIYLNMLYSYFVSLYLYECLGPSEVRRRLKFFFTCSVFVYVFQGQFSLVRSYLHACVRRPLPWVRSVTSRL